MYTEKTATDRLCTEKYSVQSITSKKTGRDGGGAVYGSVPRNPEVATAMLRYVKGRAIAFSRPLQTRWRDQHNRVMQRSAIASALRPCVTSVGRWSEECLLTPHVSDAMLNGALGFHPMRLALPVPSSRRLPEG